MIEAHPVEVQGKTCYLNEYFHNHPENVLGDFSLAKSNGHQLAVISDKDASLILEEVINKHLNLKRTKRSKKMTKVIISENQVVVEEVLDNQWREYLSGKGFKESGNNFIADATPQCVSAAKVLAKRKQWEVVVNKQNPIDKMAEAIAEKVAEKLGDLSNSSELEKLKKENEELKRSLKQCQERIEKLQKVSDSLKEQAKQKEVRLSRFKDVAVLYAKDYEEVLGENIAATAWEEFQAELELESNDDFTGDEPEEESSEPESESDSGFDLDAIDDALTEGK